MDLAVWLPLMLEVVPSGEGHPTHLDTHNNSKQWLTIAMWHGVKFDGKGYTCNIDFFTLHEKHSGCH